MRRRRDDAGYAPEFPADVRLRPRLVEDEPIRPQQLLDLKAGLSGSPPAAPLPMPTRQMRRAADRRARKGR